MSDSGITISQLLEVKSDDVQETLAEHIKECATQVSLPADLLGFAAEETARAVGNQLGRDVFELAFKAWAAIAELREYADPSKHPAGETNVLRWGKCSIKAPQAVDVKLGFAGISLPVLRLTIDLAAEFHSLALAIRDGAIRKLTPGPASASVALKYRNVTLIAPRKTPELTFEHGIEFPDGLHIG